MAEYDANNDGRGKQGHFALSGTLSVLLTISFHLFSQGI